MVKKLIKHEFIYYIRTLGIFLPIVLVFGLMTRIFSLFGDDNIIIQIISVSSTALLILACMVLLSLATIIAVIRFYKNLYSSEGYLTFTLPITNAQHIFVKILVATVCDSICLLTVFAALSIAFLNKEFFELFPVIRELFPEIRTADIVEFTIEGLFLALCATISTTLLYYTCITIGQTAKKNRILLAVGVYFIYYVATQIISTVISIVITVLGMTNALNGVFEWMELNIIPTIHIFLCFAAVISLAFSALCWHVTQRIMTKKLNLE